MTERTGLKEQEVLDALRDALKQAGLPVPDSIVLQKIPFSGQWGWATPVCFKLASGEAKGGKPINVKDRAAEIAAMIQEILERQGRFRQVEAKAGYVNIFFDTGLVADELIRRVLEAESEYGRAPGEGERVMIEYSQPNTHKAFHVGHLRNVCLGNALSNIMEFAGFETLTANYLGDIGLHVIKCLWCYLEHHPGEEPEDPAERGRWLGMIYAEADKRLSQGDRYRERVVGFISSLLRDDVGGELRAKAVSHLFAKVNEGLDAHSSDQAWRQDLTSLLELLWVQAPGEFNAVAHRPIADWVWNLWLSLDGWFDRTSGQFSADSPEKQELDRWREGYQAVGEHHGEWQYARQVRSLFQRWEQRDPELIELWKKTRQWSLEDFNRIYRELGVDFQVWFYESDVEDEGKEIVDELIQRGVAKDLRPNGPVLVEIDRQLGLEQPEYRTLVILRSDGTSLYSTKDLALAKRKFEEYEVDRSIYVVDVGQALYFQQIFKVLELWGFEQAPRCFHLAYEIVRLPSGKMSSREGSVVLFDDFYLEALSRARDSVAKKRSEEQYADVPELDEEERESAARAVALGATKYGMLAVDNNKPISFDFEAALSFDGQTAPYIQYAHARACRILEKAGGFSPERLSYSSVEISLSEIDLLEKIAQLPAEVRRAAREYKPLYIAVYLFQLAKSFNDFYRDCPVLKADEPTRQSRLALVEAARRTLANGLRLLGIPAPTAM